MSAEPTVPVWVLMLALGALGALVMLGLGLIVAHVKRDQEVREEVAVHREQIKTIQSELGDRKSGIRGWLHELANDVSPWIIRKQSERDK